MRLLLTHGFFLGEDSKEKLVMKPYVPLGLLYLSSHLRAQGFEPELYDSTFGSREELFALLDGEPGAVGIYGNLLTRPNVLAIAAYAKAKGWLVILGGPEPATYAQEYLDHGAHLIVAGEGELALERLCRADFHREAWAAIRGLLYREDGKLVNTGPAELISKLDAQPWPDRERVDIPRYLEAWRTHHGKGSVSVITARGCPYHCNWCSHSVFGKTHRRRAAVKVAEEVEWLIERYQPDMLWMADDVFTIHPGWLRDYAAAMKARGLRIPFECITRADRLDEASADLLAELGCMRVWIGSESGSQRILDAMERGVSAAQVRKAVGLCKARGIQTGMFLMWGYEGEEPDDVEATIDHVKQCRPDVFLTTVAYPIKGTPYYEKVAEKLVKLRSWHESSDREVKIVGRHSRAFYQYADELLRSEMAEVTDPVRIGAARISLYATAGEREA